MSEETNKVGNGYTPPSPEVKTALEMPIEQLEAQINNFGNEVQPTNPGTPTSAKAPETTPVPVQSVQVPEGQTEPKQAGTPEVIETPKAGETTFAELQAKKGFKSPDSLAKSYAALEKEYQRVKQEQAAARNLPTMPIPNTPVSPEGESTFLNELLERPEQTIANAFIKLNSIVNAGQVDQINTLQRKLKFEEMASNPETADFVDPEIQAQMQEEFKARPNWMENVNSNIEDAYYIARGKIKAKAEQKAFEQGKIAGEQAIQAKKGAMVEGSSAVTPIVTEDKNPMTMPLADLERMIKETSR